MRQPSAQPNRDLAACTVEAQKDSRLSLGFDHDDSNLNPLRAMVKDRIAIKEEESINAFSRYASKDVASM